MKTIHNKKILASVIMGVLMFAGTAGFALAENENNSTAEMSIPSPSVNVPIDVHINQNGKLTVTDAKVIAVASSSVTARVSFGSYNMDWVVKAATDTRVSRQRGEVAVLGDIRVGDVINFNGMIDTSMSVPTVIAKGIKDLSLPSVVMRIYEGTLTSLASSTTPTTASMTVGNKNYTVNIPNGISILDKNWSIASLSQFQVGNHIRVYGSTQYSASTTISAVIIRNTDI